MLLYAGLDHLSSRVSLIKLEWITCRFLTLGLDLVLQLALGDSDWYFFSLLHGILGLGGLTTPGNTGDNLFGMRGYCSSDLEKDDEEEKWGNVPATKAGFDKYFQGFRSYHTISP